MKKNNLKVVKIDKNKSLFNYEKKVLIKELVLDLKLGYFDFEKEKTQKVKFNLEVNYQDKQPSNDKDIKSIVNYAKIILLELFSFNIEFSVSFLNKSFFTICY